MTDTRTRTVTQEALVTNGLLVYLFARYRSVRTPFNVYAVNLCLSNLGYLSFLYPTSLYNEWRPTSSPPSKAFCVFHRFTIHGFRPVIVHTHLLVALNRLWALAAPVSYRNYHRSDSLLRPSLICLSIWLYVELFILPGIVIDALSPPSLYETVHCSANSCGPNWYLNTGLFLIYDAPLVLFLLIYPVIFAIIFSTSRLRPGHVSSIQHPTNQTENTATHDGDNHTLRPTSHGEHPVPVTAVTTNSKASCFGRLAHQSGRQFMMLTLLTFNVVISLFPAQLYYTLITFGLNPSGMFAVVGTLYALGCIFDPILFFISVTTFKEAFRQMFRLHQQPRRYC
ncbi:hypothetical protein RvY_11799 [Ramazzottius varieornatus]|uniref:G-protein coupled receptors family 1 profile domain-containing protein n=1 Tax=Ramazzottius varieornatus TaxID=947166 RepID=A0A1D1VLL2_RAMVA|nr:hypothetical protein RvY_11799 [Ramazzottius varieornatus]